MTTLHCTLRLAQRLRVAYPERTKPITTKMGSWSANYFNLGRIPHVILTNEATLLTVAIPFKPAGTFWERFLDLLEEVMQLMEIPPKAIQKELDGMRTFQYARETNRSVLGSMNDFVGLTRAYFERDPSITLQELSIRLNNVPCSPLRMRCPRDYARELLHNSLKKELSKSNLRSLNSIRSNFM